MIARDDVVRAIEDACDVHIAEAALLPARRSPTTVHVLATVTGVLNPVQFIVNRRQHTVRQVFFGRNRS